MTPHYISRENPDHSWGFTSPIGTHGNFASKSLCTDVARKTRKRHEATSEEHGSLAKILRDYFQPEPQPE